MTRMRKLAHILLFFSLVISVLGYRAVSAEHNAKTEEQTIVTKRRDVTGDGKWNRISITGVPYEPDSPFLKEINLVVDLGKGRKINVPLDAGFEPNLQFADFNRDDVDDVFITIPTGSSGGLINSYAYTFIGDKANDLNTPPPVTITGQFLDNYKIAISVPMQKPLIIDVSDRKKDYERIGLYQTNGKLNEPTEIMVDPYSLLDIAEMPDKGKGLKGVQRISGAYHADGLADVFSEWEYSDGRWELLKTEIKLFTGKSRAK